MKTLEPSTWEERRVSLPLLGRRDVCISPLPGGADCYLSPSGRRRDVCISLLHLGARSSSSPPPRWRLPTDPVPPGGTPGCISLPWDDSSHVSLCLGEKNVFIPPRGTLYLPSPPRWRLLLSLTLSPRGNTDGCISSLGTEQGKRPHLKNGENPTHTYLPGDFSVPPGDCVHISLPHLGARSSSSPPPRWRLPTDPVPPGGTPGCISLPWDDSSHVSLPRGRRMYSSLPGGRRMTCSVSPLGD